MAAQSEGDSLAGFGLALVAYLLWAALPLYLKLVQHIAVVDVLAHRVLWSLPVALAVLLAMGRTADLRRALASPRVLAMAAVTAALISVNWSVYLYAVLNDRALDAALGYFINPLFSIFLGAVVLRERLSAVQWLAVGLAAAAVAVLTLEAGTLPVLSLSLTVTWGFYALAKRALPIGPNQGFTLEVMILSPLAAGWMAWQAARGAALFGGGGVADVLLLLGCGVVTAVPLMLYANGAKRLRLTTIALMQYIAPTGIFVIAVTLFDEPFEGARRIAFPVIWAALVLYSADLLRRRR